MSKPVLSINKRDIELLHFLWKWKVATTAALSQRFFINRSKTTAYKRLWELELGRYIQSISDYRSYHSVWTLTKLGFGIIKPFLPALREDGFRSENISHDLITSAVHLGDYLLDCPTNVSFFSEQELRRLALEFYPSWVPKSELHRPDGYWHVPIGKPMATVGLEVELSPKKNVQYEVIADFYASFPQVVRVLWIVPKSSTAKILHDKFSKTLSYAPMIHNFAIFPNFQKSGWEALIECGPEAGKPIAKLIGKNSEFSPKKNSELPFLDTRKSPYKSRSFRPLELSDFRY